MTSNPKSKFFIIGLDLGKEENKKANRLSSTSSIGADKGTAWDLDVYVSFISAPREIIRTRSKSPATLDPSGSITGGAAVSMLAAGSPPGGRGAATGEYALVEGESSRPAVAGAGGSGRSAGGRDLKRNAEGQGRPREGVGGAAEGSRSGRGEGGDTGRRGEAGGGGLRGEGGGGCSGDWGGGTREREPKRQRERSPGDQGCWGCAGRCAPKCEYHRCRPCCGALRRVVTDHNCKKHAFD